ncbi:MAG: hypothetical protein M3Q40_09650 [Pseudomonadota bacterium]|nr:hypothetical protein [Pseudomonadota bacterium]
MRNRYRIVLGAALSLGAAAAPVATAQLEPGETLAGAGELQECVQLG